MALLVATTAVYLGFLFFLAWLGTRRAHKGTGAATGASLSLSLGVLVTTGTYYGHTGFAARHGVTVFAFHIGATLACMLGPALWARILRVCRTRRLHSLADLFAFRFRSPVAGALTTAVAVLASVPYISQQLRAVSESAVIVTGNRHPGLLAFVGSVILAAFTMLFGGPPSEPGARGVARTAEKTSGVIFAITFESAVKLAALSAAGVVALFVAFHGPSDLKAWLDAQPTSATTNVGDADGAQWPTFVLIGFVSMFITPRQFHVAFASAASDRAFRRAMAGLPVYLLVINVLVVTIAWGALRVVPDAPADFSPLTIPAALGFRKVTWLAFLGGISAASAMVIVTTVALVRMVVVHFVLPTGRRFLTRDLYRRLAWVHRAIALALVIGGYLFFLLDENRAALVDISTVSNMAFAQFLPGVLAAVFFPRATGKGFAAGLLTGVALWFATALAPMLGWFPSLATLLAPQAASLDPWSLSTFLSVGANAVVMAAVSMATRPTPEAIRAAAQFLHGPGHAEDVLATVAPATARGAAIGMSPESLEARLVPLIGQRAAATELRRTMKELSLESGLLLGPVDLARVRRCLEANLTELLGPVLGHRIVADAIAAAIGAERGPPLTLADQLRSMDEALDKLGPSLQGPAAELDVYRRFLRAVLEGLPLGVCAVGPVGMVILWNTSLASLARVAASDVVGHPMGSVPEPIGRALQVALREPGRSHELTIHFDDGDRTLLLHASRLDPDLARAWSGTTVAVVDDVTERRALESELVHRNRLATIGRVAAGVAHEIGNPLNGITLLASSLRRNASDPAERLDMLLEEASRIDTIVRELLSYSRPSPVVAQHTEAVPMHDLVEEAFRLVRFDRRGERVTLENACAPDSVVLADPKRLTQVIVNLVANAIDAVPAEGGHVVVGSKNDDGQVVVTVEDDGAGIAPSVLPHLFEPFFSTKAPGEGTGLGLWLVHNIVRDHGGEVSAVSEPGRGTTVIVRLPRAS